VADESELLKGFRAAYLEGSRAWNEGDFERAYGGLPEDFDYEPLGSWPHARRLRGPAEIVPFFEDFREAFPDARGTRYEFIQAGEQTVIVGFQVTGTGASSGAGTEMEIWQVWEIAEGLRPLRIKEFPDRRTAIEAAGAKEPAER
jgi:ketosteroid isomerase-like protein